MTFISAPFNITLRSFAVTFFILESDDPTISHDAITSHSAIWFLNNSDFYEFMAKYKDKISYRGDLSIVLVDVDSLSILEETYLSHYDEKETKTEFYL